MGNKRKAARTSIGDVLFGRTRQAVLRLLFSNPDRRFYQRLIINTASMGSGTVQRELEALTRAGILVRTVEGRQAYYQANHGSPVFENLRELIKKSFGIVDVLKTALRSIAKGVDAAFVYGSIASGNEGPESDIDLMVIGGRLSLEKIVRALDDAQRELGREINPSVYGTEEFYRKLGEGHHFVASVADGPKMFLIGEEGEFKRLAKVRLAQRAQSNSAGNRRPARRRIS